MNMVDSLATDQTIELIIDVHDFMYSKKLCITSHSNDYIVMTVITIY